MTRSNFNIPAWIKVLFFVAVIGVLLSILGVVFFNDVDDVIGNQLTKIREKQFTQAYYDYTSKDFQATTSLEVFKDFISLYPILENNIEYTQEEKHVQNDLATVRGTLKSGPFDEIKAEWVLVKENDVWKIASIKLLEKSEDFTTRSQIKELESAVFDHLSTIKDGEILEAYYSFSSTDFQNDISFTSFKEYVTRHSILSDFIHIVVTDTRIENNRGLINVLLNSEISSNWLCEYSFIREGDQWKVLSLRIILPPDVAKKDIATNPESLVPPVKKVLDHILFGQMRKAYQSTSKDYQKKYSYQDFEEFVQRNNVIIRRDFADIQTGVIENGRGALRVDLHGDKGKTTLEFILRLERGAWLVWDMQIIKERGQNNASISNDLRKTYSVAKDLEVIIQRKLSYLRNFTFSKAYLEFTTKRYKQYNQLADFENFLGAHPEFVNNSESHFNRIALNDNLATMRGKITTSQKTTYPVRYDFVFEGGDWKIDAFTSLPEEEEIADVEYIFDAPLDKKIVEPMELSSLDIGINVDTDGIIVKPSQILKGEIDNLYFNIYIKNGIEKALVTMTLKHVESGSAAPDLTTNLNQDGNTIIVFSYDRPEEGWPDGEYVVKIASSTGLKIMKTFRINKNEHPGVN